MNILIKNVNLLYCPFASWLRCFYVYLRKSQRQKESNPQLMASESDLFTATPVVNLILEQNEHKFKKQHKIIFLTEISTRITKLTKTKNRAFAC